jgi:GntR family transcriptional regulator of gluconate operon
VDIVTYIQPVREIPLGEQVAQHLREMIIRRDLAPGTHLVEDSFAAEFGVSRGPMRDAFKLLGAEGLVESRRRGIFVRGLSLEDIDDLYSLREAIESLAVRLAISRSEKEDWQQIHQLIASMRVAAENRDYAAYATADIGYHSLIYELSRHHRLSDVWNQYVPILTALLQFTVAEEQDLQASAEDHQFLLNLMESGETEHAVFEIRSHLRRAQARMTNAYRRAIDDSSTAGGVSPKPEATAPILHR